MLPDFRHFLARICPNGKVFQSTLKFFGNLDFDGDPSWKSSVTMDDRGHERESWTWMDHGMIINLSDGEIMSKRNFQGTGEGTWGLR